MSAHLMFRSGDKPINLEFMRFIGVDTAYYEGFRSAADLVIKSLPSDEPGEDDAMFFPVAFLYRHAIENQLKYILDVCTKIEWIKEHPKCMGGHSIEKLWSETRKVLLANGWDETMLAPLDPYIAEMHKTDPTGQEFRYATTTKSAPSLSTVPDEISFVQLQQAVSFLFKGLDDVCHIVVAEWDNYCGCP